MSSNIIKTSGEVISVSHLSKLPGQVPKKGSGYSPTPGYVAINGNSLLEWVSSRHTVLQGSDAETS